MNINYKRVYLSLKNMFNPSSFSAKIRIFSKSDYKKQKNVTNDLKLFLFFVIISLFLMCYCLKSDSQVLYGCFMSIEL